MRVLVGVCWDKKLEFTFLCLLEHRILRTSLSLLTLRAMTLVLFLLLLPAVRACAGVGGGRPTKMPWRNGHIPDIAACDRCIFCSTLLPVFVLVSFLCHTSAPIGRVRI